MAAAGTNSGENW